MTELRRQFESARRDYAAGSYAGDLAADVLAPRGRSLRWLVPAASGLAAAVAAVIVLIAYPRAPAPHLVAPSVPATGGPTIAGMMPRDMWIVPAAPRGMTLSPAVPALAFPSMPELPSPTAGGELKSEPLTFQEAV